MKYKKIILKPIFNYIPNNTDKENYLENDTNTLNLNGDITPKSNISQEVNIENISSKDNKSNLILKKTHIKFKNNLTQENNTLLKNNIDYKKILQETDELIKKLKSTLPLKKEKKEDFLINSKESSNILNDSFSLETLHDNKTSKDLKLTKQLFKIVNNHTNISTFKYFIKNNTYLLLLDLVLIIFLLFIILKFIRFLFKKNTIPEELIYITIKDPFEEAVKKTKNLPKIGTLIVKNTEDIPSSVYISGDLIIIGKVKLPEYVYVKGDVICENYVEIDTLISEKNIKILNGGLLSTLLATKKNIYLSKDFESKGILIAEQIITYDYKEYDFDLPISSSKRKVLEYKGNFKVPEEITLAQDLIIFGNLEILPFAKILGDIKVYGNVKVWNNVKISGGIYASGKVTLMDNCIVGKDIISANKIEIYPGCRLNIFSGRIATYKNILLNKNICIFGAIISPMKVK